MGEGGGKGSNSTGWLSQILTNLLSIHIINFPDLTQPPCMHLLAISDYKLKVHVNLHGSSFFIKIYSKVESLDFRYGGYQEIFSFIIRVPEYCMRVKEKSHSIFLCMVSITKVYFMTYNFHSGIFFQLQIYRLSRSMGYKIMRFF